MHLILTKIAPRRNERFELVGWDTLGMMLLVHTSFVAEPCDFDPKVSIISFQSKDVFVKESVEQIHSLLFAKERA